MTSATVELASALIALPSVSPHDAGCFDLIVPRLEALGFICERFDRNGTSNLYAQKGTLAPILCFAGHTDVVPAGNLEQWKTPPFEPTLQAGQLYGRGAADMKGAIAAFITAVEVFLAQHPDPLGSIALLLTSDEEGPARDGTVAVVDIFEAQGKTLDFCIVGEPTSNHIMGDMIKNGRRGSLSGHLVVKGVQGHIAYPHLAQNPIHLAAPALAELTEMEWDQGNAFFPKTTWQISNIHAGTGVTNIIPGELVVDFNFRFSTEVTAEALKARTETLLNRHGLKYDLTWSLSGNPFLTSEGALVEALSSAIFAETGLKPELSTSGGTSDGRFIARICPQVVECGVRNATIHQVNECVSVADLAVLHRVYARTLALLLTEESEPL